MGAPNPALRSPSAELLWQVRVTWPWALSQHAPLRSPRMHTCPIPACPLILSQHAPLSSYHHAPQPSPHMLPNLLPACSPVLYHHVPGPLPACSPAFSQHAPRPSPSMLPGLLPACSLALSQHAPRPSPSMLPGPLPAAPSHGPVGCQEFFKGSPFSRGFPSSHRSIDGYLLCFLRPQMWTRSRKRPGPSQPPVWAHQPLS